MTNKYYEDELRKISNIRNGLRDQYNSLESNKSIDDIEQSVHKDLDYAPSPKQTWKSYVTVLEIYKKLVEKHNIQAHINGPKGSWFTHRNPPTCWMCADLNLISVMFDAIAFMASKHPNNTF